jgi:hypothetical protein
MTVDGGEADSAVDDFRISGPFIFAGAQNGGDDPAAFQWDFPALGARPAHLVVLVVGAAPALRLQVPTGLAGALQPLRAGSSHDFAEHLGCVAVAVVGSGNRSPVGLTDWRAHLHTHTDTHLQQLTGVHGAESQHNQQRDHSVTSHPGGSCRHAAGRPAHRRPRRAHCPAALSVHVMPSVG